MNENIKKSRLLFEIARKQRTMEASQVVAGEHTVTGSSLGIARDTFAYERGMAEVEIGKKMLNGQDLVSSVQTVAENFRINEYAEIERDNLSL